VKFKIDPNYYILEPSALPFRFDTGGPGSCLKRYSDPTFFKKASVTSGEVTTGKIQIDKKARRSKVCVLVNEET
jgi:hypothetical protein